MLKTALCVVAAGAVLGFALPDKPGVERAEPAEARPTGASGETLLERKENGHFYVEAAINGELVHAIVDTGATGVALTVDDAERLGLEFSTAEFTEVGTGASGRVRGKRITLESVSIDDKEVTNVSGVILEGLEISLLGQSYLSQIGAVEMSGDYMVLR